MFCRLLRFKEKRETKAKVVFSHLFASISEIKFTGGTIRNRPLSKNRPTLFELLIPFENLKMFYSAALVCLHGLQKSGGTAWSGGEEAFSRYSRRRGQLQN